MLHLKDSGELIADRKEDRCWLVMDLARGGDLHNKVFDELNLSISRGLAFWRF